MDNIGMNNLLSMATGLLLILCCCWISYFTQKHLFNKYKNKVKNIISNEDKTKP